jgi:hypothetical protein
VPPALAFGAVVIGVYSEAAKHGRKRRETFARIFNVNLIRALSCSFRSPTTRVNEQANISLSVSFRSADLIKRATKIVARIFLHFAYDTSGSSFTIWSECDDGLARYGNDVVVVWDSDDEGTDAYLSAALMICKALAVRNAAANDEIAADFDLLEKTIREIERQSSFLEEIKISSSTIKNGADKILNRVETMRAAFVKQIEALDTQASLLRKLVQ